MSGLKEECTNFIRTFEYRNTTNTPTTLSRETCHLPNGIVILIPAVTALPAYMCLASHYKTSLALYFSTDKKGNDIMKKKKKKIYTGIVE